MNGQGLNDKLVRYCYYLHLIRFQVVIEFNGRRRINRFTIAT